MTDAQLTDLVVFERWRQGDNAMGKLFYQRTAPKLLAYFRRNVFDRNVVEELMHDTFLECMRSRSTTVTNPQGYLFGIASHMFSRHIRGRRRELGRVSDEVEDLNAPIDALDPNPEFIGIQNDEDRLFMKAMRRLPFDQQIVLELSFWERMSGREIGEALALPEGTVRSRIRLGRQRLKLLLVELQESPEQFQTATLSFNSWQTQIHDYMAALGPDWDKDGDGGL
jgi:RNA polymerase sigma factor (sigma-70 family)